MTAGEGVNRILLEPLFEPALPAVGPAQPQHPEQRSAGLDRVLPPDAGNDNHGGNHEDPAKRVDGAERHPEQIRVRAVRGFQRKLAGVNRAG